MDIDVEQDNDGLQYPAQARDHKQAYEEWDKFLTRCICTRLSNQKFADFVSILHSKHPLPPVAVADIFLKPCSFNRDTLDPLVQHQYIRTLSDKKYIDAPSILNALYKYSTSHTQAQAVGHTDLDAAQAGDARWRSSYGQEETNFYSLTKAVAQGTGIKSRSDALGVCKIVAKWMTLFTLAASAFAQDIMGQLHSTRAKEDMEASRAAFVMLLLGVCENATVLQALSNSSAKEVRKALSESLTSFVPSIMQSGASAIADRLEAFRTGTLASFEPVDKKNEAAKAEFDDLLDSTLGLENFPVTELPVVNTRAGLYIYLNASLVCRPFVDDAYLYNYLQIRYNGDYQTCFIDLILASFDVLANAVFRSEGQKTAHVLHSYLINKLPVLLANLAQPLSSVFPPVTPQYCITTALAQVDTNAFPTLSAMFDVSTSSNNTFTDSVRQEFCWACCLHGLIPESAIEGLLGEISYQSLPEGGKLVKEKLFNKCMSNPETITVLVGEIDKMDGNVGAICQALAEVITHMCATKDTMTLKQICSQLAKKPLSLDVLLLFVKLDTVLRPLCDLLDNWKYDDEQGEYQPVYEEFGSILLLVLAFVHRYNLSALDLGVTSSDSFTAKLLCSGQYNRPMEELSEQESAQLGGWIQGLFNSESGGLGDELMSSCTPQDFHLLVSTLFYQTVLALSGDRLPEENLKNGFEYLVDTFLLPSLVMAVRFLSDYLRTSRGNEPKAVIKILQIILLTKQGSNEAQAMLAAVITIVAKPLEHALRSHQRQDPKNQDIEPLLKAVKDSNPVPSRTGGSDQKEFEGWSNTPNGGLQAAVRYTIQTMVQWSLHPGLNVTPTPYTHRQMIFALKTLGAKRLLQLIMDEVKLTSEAGSASYIYDIAVSLICAPDVTNLPPPLSQGDPTLSTSSTQPRLSLRQVLRWQAEDCKKIQKTDPVAAEHIVRLFRRVEAQMHIVIPQAPTLMQEDLGLGLDDNAATSLDGLAATQGDVMVPDDTGMDLDLGAGAADMGLDMGVGDGGLGLGGDDDIFGSLGPVGDGTDLLDGWDGML
ncbi:mediator of RNA polymerase II transcription subunit 5 [Truncatella angustata]|uniref:Mediator of RNA polymerase II transcription subunit 5 n=1 Tax=Truncatella angustata TaxID=152316 RepID=A0A9P8UFU1_9PEZI|nr:mediator of RNA polymerase II transcription subunit 5 [Truncatella angustata]KAH6649137.1 mediator of RNA polymerase II transcription subunit 5 [Truncatella angustata]